MSRCDDFSAGRVPARALAALLLAASTLLAGPVTAAPPRPRATKPARVPLGEWVRRNLFHERIPEFVEMLWAVATGSQMGPGEGWFHPGQGRYGWKWLAQRFDANHDGRITRKEFQGPAEWFDRLDRDRDGVLTAADFDWSDRSPFLQRARLADMVFSRFDADSNGRISRAEWESFFARASKGKKYMTPEDLRAALIPPAPARRPGGSGGGPSPEMLLRGLLGGELGSFREGPDVGQRAPDFTLHMQDGKKEIRLSQFRGKKPVVLVFGSFT